MNGVLNINTDASVVFANKLEKMHRSALPVAIRGALNKAAFDVKQNTMPRTAKSSFIQRSPNFFKANSKVEMAKGFLVNDMKATVGFTSQGLKGSSNYAVKELEQQEKGGRLTNKSFRPTNIARGGSYTKLVRPANRLSAMKNIVVANRAKGVNKGQRFIKSAVHAGKGGLVLSEYNGKTILWRINSLNKTKTGKMKLTPLYTYKKGRDVKVSKTKFMQTASLQSNKMMDSFFVKEAKRQIDKLRNA